jgi:hypothetical protein
MRRVKSISSRTGWQEDAVQSVVSTFELTDFGLRRPRTGGFLGHRRNVCLTVTKARRRFRGPDGLLWSFASVSPAAGGQAGFALEDFGEVVSILEV